MILRGPNGGREIMRTGYGYYEALLEAASAPGPIRSNPLAPAVGPIQQPSQMGDPPTFRLPGDGVTIRRDRPLTVS
ncbi:MAG: hypothetical protein R2748_32225 [Bryobacterales bacterium]